MENILKTWSGNFDAISFFLGLAFALIGYVGDTWFRQPKLVISGGGGGGGEYSTCNISLRNEIGFFGIKIGSTSILGFHIHPRIQIGQYIERNPARDCYATLFLADTNECVGQLWWQDKYPAVTDRVTIQSGDTATLFAFSHKRDSDEYFVYQTTQRETGEVKLPPSQARFHETKNFRIEVRHSHNKILKTNVQVFRTFDGKLYFKQSNGSSSFF